MAQTREQKREQNTKWKAQWRAEARTVLIRLTPKRKGNMQNRDFTIPAFVRTTLSTQRDPREDLIHGPFPPFG